MVPRGGTLILFVHLPPPASEKMHSFSPLDHDRIRLKNNFFYLYFPLFSPFPSYFFPASLLLLSFLYSLVLFLLLISHLFFFLSFPPTTLVFISFLLTIQFFTPTFLCNNVLSFMSSSPKRSPDSVCGEYIYVCVIAVMVCGFKMQNGDELKN